MDDKIFAHTESSLNYEILNGSVRENYFTAGGLEDDETDYVFNNVGFSLTFDKLNPNSDKKNKHNA